MDIFVENKLIMGLIHFRTRISKFGTIKLPDHSLLINKEVEVIIVPTLATGKKKMKVSEFIDKWAGYLTLSENEDTKYNYLVDKYK